MENKFQILRKKSTDVFHVSVLLEEIEVSFGKDNIKIYCLSLGDDEGNTFNFEIQGTTNDVKSMVVYDRSSKMRLDNEFIGLLKETLKRFIERNDENEKL